MTVGAVAVEASPGGAASAPGIAASARRLTAEVIVEPIRGYALGVAPPVDVDEVDVEAVDLGHELGQGI